MAKWSGVPAESRLQWQRIFAASTEGISLSAACPCCGHLGLRRYYGKASSRPARPGYVGVGACWEWCTFCKVYEHSSSLVPAWWQPMPEVMEHKLTVEPEQLEIQLSQLGVPGA
jgi:hypothetical protein